MIKTAAISSVQFTQPNLFLFFALRCNNKGAKNSSQQHLTMFLSLTTALNHFITMLNHSNNHIYIT